MGIDRRAVLFSAAVVGAGVLTLFRRGPGTPAVAETVHFPVSHTDAQWRQMLTPIQYDILRQQGTEPAGSSPLDAEERPGVYSCAGCNHALYDAKTKFHSGTGWPSFWAPLDGAVQTSQDNSFFMERTEVHCATCGGHLGHVFDDGPRPTGLRYCMNGAVLNFRPA